MKTRRLLIASFVVLTTGIGLLFGYCNGTTGFSAGYPLSGSSLKLDVTTTGFPAIAGLPLTLIGSLLLVISFIAAIVAEIRSPRSKSKPAQNPKLADSRNPGPL
jgi:hypothetical protein